MTRLSHLSFVLALATAVSGFSSIHPHAAATSRYQSQQSTPLSRLQLSSPKTDDETSTSTSTTSNTRKDVLDDANDALASVGWAPPREDGEMTSDDPFVQDIDAGIQRDFGVGLDELLNPAKVVNLERDLYNLRLELAGLTGVTLDEQAASTNTLTTERCDGGGGGEEADAVRARIDKKEKDLLIERRSVFRGWLKNVFLGQAILSFGLSWVMATNPEVLFGQFGWFQSYNM